MKLPPLLAHILIFILNCGGELDLTPDDLWRSSTSKGHISIRNAKSGENCVLPGTIFINYFCIPQICQMHRETTIIDKNNSKVKARLHQVHFKVKIAKECENIPFI